MLGSVAISNVVRCLALLALMACIPPAAAQTGPGVELANSAEENRVVISGAVQKGQPIPAMGGNILLKSPAKERVELRARSTPLTLESDSRIFINRGDVSIPAGTTIEPGQARDVRISVANVSRPGRYRGTLRVWAQGYEESKALDVPVILEVGLRPALALLGSAPQWNLVRCEWDWVCALARKLTNDAATQDAQSFKVENQSALAAERIDSLALLRGTNNKSNDAVLAAKVTMPDNIPGGGNSDVKVAVSRNQLDADSYEGSIRIHLPGPDESLTVPLAVNVRDGPVLPLFLILAGIVVGRWGRALESPEIKSQLKALERFYIVRSDIKRVRHAGSVTFLRSEAADLERLIGRGSTSEQKLTEQLNRFENQIDFLARLDTLEIDVAAMKLPALSTAIATDMAAARNALFGGDETAAQQSYDAARKKIRDEASKPAPMSEGARTVVASVLLSLDASAATPGGPTAVEPVRTDSPFAKFLGFLSGDPSAGLQVRYYLIKPLLAVILLFTLSAIGLYTLYVKVPTFGASGLYEYLGLFVWGLGAEVAQRTLTGLQLPAR